MRDLFVSHLNFYIFLKSDFLSENFESIEANVRHILKARHK